MPAAQASATDAHHPAVSDTALTGRETISLGHATLGLWTTVEAAGRCDPGMRLNDHEYHPFSGWRIPRGVEIRYRGSKPDAFIGGNVRSVAGTLTGWNAFEPSHVHVLIHCVPE